MKAVVRKWGNSASVRIPAAVLAASHLTIDQSVEIRAENGRIVIASIQEADLEALIDGITPNNLHGDVSFGPAMGGEAF